MYFRAQPPPRDGARQAGFFLFCWLVPGVALSAPTILPDTSGRFVSRPYLQVASAPPLRFTELAPPPDLTSHPPAGAPPQPAAVSLKETITETKTEPPSTPAPTVPAIATIPVPASLGGHETPVPESDTSKEKTAPPAAILPDDTRPKVKAEDFLPFFQFPSNSASDALSAPAPGRQPPSSATYRQQ